MPEIDELLSILRDGSRPMEERIEAAKSLYKLYRSGETIPVVEMIAKIGIDELKEMVENGEYAKGTEEEALIKGVFEVKKEAIYRRLRKLPLAELAKSLVSPESEMERKIAMELLSGREGELKREANAMLAAARHKMAEAITKHAEFLEESIPIISDPVNMGFLSKVQVKKVEKPSKWYAKQAFRNGLWNMKWGLPSRYEIDVKNEIRYVDKPANDDFAYVVFCEERVWDYGRWGDPRNYKIPEVKLEISDSKYSKPHILEHRTIQEYIKEMLEFYGFKVELEYWISGGRVDIAAFKGNMSIGIEVTRTSDALKDARKLVDHFDLAFVCVDDTRKDRMHIDVSGKRVLVLHYNSFEDELRKQLSVESSRNRFYILEDWYQMKYKDFSL